MITATEPDLLKINSLADASQLKKVLKDQRKKIYADLLVQGTNDSSIVSKRSVEMLYSSIDGIEVPQFFHHFVKKPQRRSPAINRGYWIRMNAIKNCIDKIIENENCKTNVIINLGCGYDPLPFQIIDNSLHFLKHKTKDMDFLCIDIDYPDLISKKVHMINNSSSLMKIIGDPEDCNIEGVQLKTKNYAAVGCNLRDLKLFQRQLTLLGLHGLNTCSIFVAEVSLAYMLPEHADSIIEESSTFPKSHFLILEQLLPTGEPRDPFGRTMLHHFSRLNTPLKCVPTYRTIHDQILRFKNMGYPEVEARDLLGCWDELISLDEKRKVRAVESFDESEEFVLYTQHYIVLHATNSVKCCFNPDNEHFTLPHLKVNNSVKLTYTNLQSSPETHRKFSGIALDNETDDCIIVGGSSQVRLSTSMILSQNSGRNLNMKPYKLPQRMCHSLTAMPNHEFILIGGRNAPHKPYNDCWKMIKGEDDLYQWVKLPNLPTARSRHSAVKLSDHEILCFGGLDLNNEVDSVPFIVYDVATNNWREISMEGDPISNLNSATMTFDTETQTGFITGGMGIDNELNNSLYKLNYNRKSDTIKIQKIKSDNLLLRYGAKMSQLTKNQLILVGGVSPNFSLDKLTSILTIDLDTLELNSVPISDDLWHDGNMFVGFEMLKRYDDSLVCVGGGAVCFGFGSFWNDKVLTISIDNDAGRVQAETHEWIPTLEKILTTN